METNAAASVNEAVSNEFENLTDEDVILRIKSDAWWNLKVLVLQI